MALGEPIRVSRLTQTMEALGDLNSFSHAILEVAQPWQCCESLFPALMPEFKVTSHSGTGRADFRSRAENKGRQAAAVLAEWICSHASNLRAAIAKRH